MSSQNPLSNPTTIAFLGTAINGTVPGAAAAPAPIAAQSAPAPSSPAAPVTFSAGADQKRGADLKGGSEAANAIANATAARVATLQIAISPKHTGGIPGITGPERKVTIPFHLWKLNPLGAIGAAFNLAKQRHGDKPYNADTDTIVIHFDLPAKDKEAQTLWGTFVNPILTEITNDNHAWAASRLQRFDYYFTPSSVAEKCPVKALTDYIQKRQSGDNTQNLTVEDLMSRNVMGSGFIFAPLDLAFCKFFHQACLGYVSGDVKLNFTPPASRAKPIELSEGAVKHAQESLASFKKMVADGPFKDILELELNNGAEDYTSLKSVTFKANNPKGVTLSGLCTLLHNSFFKDPDATDILTSIKP